MADEELKAALKLAKSKKVFFAFFPKGTEGKLIVSKLKIPPKVVAATKKEVGGGPPVTGKCFAEGNTMVFQVIKAPPGTMAATIKRIVKKETGLAIVPDFRLASAADVEEEDTGAAEGAAAPAAPPPPGKPAPAAPPTPGKPGAAPPAGQGNVMQFQKALQTLGYNPGKIDGLNGPNTQTAVKAFQKDHNLTVDGIVGRNTQAALAAALKSKAAAGAGAPAGADATAAPGVKEPPPPGVKTPPPPPPSPAQPAGFDLPTYQAARQTVISSLKSLAGKVAGTKHGSAAGVLKEINTIIAKLPASPKANELDKLRDFIAHDEIIAAAEDVPDHFHDLDIKEPLLKAWK